jgi:hypothetical protein
LKEVTCPANMQMSQRERGCNTLKLVKHILPWRSNSNFARPVSYFGRQELVIVTFATIASLSSITIAFGWELVSANAITSK